MLRVEGQDRSSNSEEAAEGALEKSYRTLCSSSAEARRHGEKSCIFNITTTRKHTQKCETIIDELRVRNKSNHSRKTKARNAKGFNDEYEVNCNFRPIKVTQMENFSITFTDDEALRVQHPHDDAIVIKAI